MEIIKGKFTEAKVFADDMEDYARAQLKMICDDPVSEGSAIRVMPDVHPGKVGTIGLTMTVGERIIPHLLGIDIGCGMTCAAIKERRIEFQKLDKVIRECIPSGFQIRKKAHYMADCYDMERLHCHKHIHQDKAALSLGTLGGGNHFIEVDRDEDGKLYIIIHTGSRHLGKEVTDHYVDTGVKALKEKGVDVPYPMTWLKGELMEDYIADVSAVQEYAQLNRDIILTEILKGMKLKETERFSSVHNYIEVTEHERIVLTGKETSLGENVLPETRILRKGAISAREGERVIIPINMRDGVILGTGKGNFDWNESAPHGSGRSMRRDEVKNHYTVSVFKNEMKGIYCSCIGADTLDEAPFAYRPIDRLIENIEETVEVTHILRPIYNFKAGGKA